MALPNPAESLGINLTGLTSSIGYIVVFVIVIGLIALFFIWYINKKLWYKKITDFDIIGDRFDPIFRDTAKNVKIGHGGFEVIYLKKKKVYRLAFGERIGKNAYYFFTAPDGYMYNGYLGKQITTDGRVPVITTNPTMRAQYTALEKQIEALHGQKISFMDKYGGWMFGIGFILVAGLIYWFLYKDIPKAMGSMSSFIDSAKEYTQQLANACSQVNPNPAKLTGA